MQGVQKRSLAKMLLPKINMWAITLYTIWTFFVYRQTKGPKRSKCFAQFSKDIAWWENTRKRRSASAKTKAVKLNRITNFKMFWSHNSLVWVKKAIKSILNGSSLNCFFWLLEMEFCYLIMEAFMFNLVLLLSCFLTFIQKKKNLIL